MHYEASVQRRGQFKGMCAYGYRNVNMTNSQSAYWKSNTYEYNRCNIQSRIFYEEVEKRQGQSLEEVVGEDGFGSL